MPKESDRAPPPPPEVPNDHKPSIFPKPGQNLLAGFQARIVWRLKRLGLFGTMVFIILCISVLMAAFVIPVWVTQKINEKGRGQSIVQAEKQDVEMPDKVAVHPVPQMLSAAGSTVDRGSSLEPTRFDFDRHKIDEMIGLDYDAAAEDLAFGMGLFWVGEFAGSVQKYDHAFDTCLPWIGTIDLVTYRVIEITFLRSCANWIRGQRDLVIEDCKFAETQLHDLAEALQDRDNADVKLSDVKLLEESMSRLCEWYEGPGNPQRKEHQDVNN